MNDALKQLESLLQNAAAGPRPFPPTSRYAGLPLLTRTMPDGRTVVYLSRRVVPPAGNGSNAETHTVVDGDRLDNLSAQYIGYPEQWWRIADANEAMRPTDLVETAGRALRLTSADGVPPGSDE